MSWGWSPISAPRSSAGGAIFVSDGFKVDRTLAWLSDAEMGITHYAGVPQMMESFRRQPGFDVSKLRHMTALVTGGAPHSPADIAAWLEAGVAMASGFGMSETGTVFGMPCDAEAVRAKPGSVGVTTPWVEVRVVDGEGKDCPVGSAGEMLLRGENITCRLLARSGRDGQGHRSGRLVRDRRYRAHG